MLGYPVGRRFGWPSYYQLDKSIYSSLRELKLINLIILQHLNLMTFKRIIKKETFWISLSCKIFVEDAWRQNYSTCEELLRLKYLHISVSTKIVIRGSLILQNLFQIYKENNLQFTILWSSGRVDWYINNFKLTTKMQL